MAATGYTGPTSWYEFDWATFAPYALAALALGAAALVSWRRRRRWFALAFAAFTGAITLIGVTLSRQEWAV